MPPPKPFEVGQEIWWGNEPVTTWRVLHIFRNGYLLILRESTESFIKVEPKWCRHFEGNDRAAMKAYHEHVSAAHERYARENG